VYAHHTAVPEPYKYSNFPSLSSTYASAQAVLSHTNRLPVHTHNKQALYGNTAYNNNIRAHHTSVHTHTHINDKQQRMSAAYHHPQTSQISYARTVAQRRGSPAHNSSPVVPLYRAPEYQTTYSHALSYNAPSASGYTTASPSGYTTSNHNVVQVLFVFMCVCVYVCVSAYVCVCLSNRKLIFFVIVFIIILLL